MKKRLIAVWMVMLMLFSVAACGNNADNTETAQNTDGAYPITITDHAGREVIIEEEPETIISGYYINQYADRSGRSG